MPHARELSTFAPIPCRTSLDGVCRRAIARAGAGTKRGITYVPERGVDVMGCWDASSLEHALALLVREILLASRNDEPVDLRWRIQGRDVVVRIHYPRLIGSGEKLVTFFDADSVEGEDRQRFVDARAAVLALGGTLARVRTLRGTTYVVTLPRGSRVRSVGDRPARARVHAVGDRPARAREAARATASARGVHAGSDEPCVSLFVGGGLGRGARLDRLVARAGELLERRCSRRQAEALLHAIRELGRTLRDPAQPAALFASPRRRAAVVPPRDVPDVVVVGTAFDTEPLRRGASRPCPPVLSVVTGPPPAG